MNVGLVARAFEEGVKAALKFFRSSGGRKNAARAAEAVMRNMTNAANAAKNVKR